MTTYTTARIEQARFIRNEDFRDQLTGCLIYAANQVVAEADTTPDHGPRYQWAQAILQNPQNQVQKFAPFVLANPTIATAAAAGTPPTDSDIDYVVASLFTDFAKLSAAGV